MIARIDDIRQLPLSLQGWDTIERQFLAFHRENPRVYELLRRFALDAQAAGHRHYSIDAIMHRVRWHVEIETRTLDGFKINNNFSSRYARYLMEAEPRLRGFFHTRTLRSQ